VHAALFGLPFFTPGFLLMRRRPYTTVISVIYTVYKRPDKRGHSTISYQIVCSSGIVTLLHYCDLSKNSNSYILYINDRINAATVYDISYQIVCSSSIVTLLHYCDLSKKSNSYINDRINAATVRYRIRSSAT